MYYGFGGSKCKDKFVNHYIINPKRDVLNGFYKSIGFFMCSSILEGHYNPASEATWNGCALLVNNCKRNGVHGSIDKQHMYVYEDVSDIPEIIKNVDPKEYLEKVEGAQNDLIKNVGTRSECMKKMIRILAK